MDDATGAEVETFEIKIFFDPRDCDPRALEMNHWSEEAWRGAPQAELAAHRFAGFLRAHATHPLISKAGKPYRVAKLIGHNAAGFDGPRLTRLFQRCEMFMPADFRIRCTLQRALWYFDERPELVPPVDFKLATLCQYFQIPVTETHEALADVRLTAALARALGCVKEAA